MQLTSLSHYYVEMIKWSLLKNGWAKFNEIWHAWSVQTSNWINWNAALYNLWFENEKALIHLDYIQYGGGSKMGKNLKYQKSHCICDEVDCLLYLCKFLKHLDLKQASINVFPKKYVFINFIWSLAICHACLHSNCGGPSWRMTL